jgi:hypothetical protein
MHSFTAHHEAKPNRVNCPLLILSLLPLLGGEVRAQEGTAEPGYLGVAWGESCSDALDRFVKRGFTFEHASSASQSPIAPHVFASERSTPVCAPETVDVRLARSGEPLEAILGSTGNMAVRLLCRKGAFVGIISTLNRLHTHEYLCILKAAGEVTQEVRLPGGVVEQRARRDGAIRYLEHRDGDDRVSYVVLAEAEDRRLREAQARCTR